VRYDDRVDDFAFAGLLRRVPRARSVFGAHHPAAVNARVRLADDDRIPGGEKLVDD